VGAGPDEPCPSGGVGLRVASGTRGNPDGDGAGGSREAYLNGAVAENGQLGPRKLMALEEFADERLLGKVLVGAESAEDAAIDEGGNPDARRLAPDIGLVGAAGDVERDSAVSEALDELQRAGHPMRRRVLRARLECLDGVADHLMEPANVDVLIALSVEDPIRGDLAVSADHLDQMLHLEDGLDARGFVDVFQDLGLDLGGGGLARGDGLAHDRRHDSLPALTYEGDGAIEIEEGVLYARSTGRGVEDLQIGHSLIL